MIEREPTFYVYHLNNKDHIHELLKEANPQHVLMILRWLKEHKIDIDYTLTCEHCGVVIELEDTQLGDFHGIGGIRIDAGSILCGECYTWVEERVAACDECGCCVDLFEHFNGEVPELPELVLCDDCTKEE